MTENVEILQTHQVSKKKSQREKYKKNEVSLIIEATFVQQRSASKR